MAAGACQTICGELNDESTWFSKRRYCAIEDCMLYVSEEMGGKPLQAIPLDPTEVKIAMHPETRTQKPRIVIQVTATSQTFTFSTTTTEECQRWFVALTQPFYEVTATPAIAVGPPRFRPLCSGSGSYRAFSTSMAASPVVPASLPPCMPLDDLLIHRGLAQSPEHVARSPSSRNTVRPPSPSEQTDSPATAECSAVTSSQQHGHPSAASPMHLLQGFISLNCPRCGYLDKCSKVLGWKRRYFELRGRWLLYWPAEASRSTPAKLLDLKECLLSIENLKDGFGFSLDGHSLRHEAILRCSSELERDWWVFALLPHCNLPCLYVSRWENQTCLVSWGQPLKTHAYSNKRATEARGDNEIEQLVAEQGLVFAGEWECTNGPQFGADGWQYAAWPWSASLHWRTDPSTTTCFRRRKWIRAVTTATLQPQQPVEPAADTGA
eukprot:TRINITY_DN15900_c0_g1_i1.p1 TRINITY_DN15900_c0_g1~~TRINITY_DN15900_c0_g1_i1.p1  ORF type:complete len:437 (-),score=27.40 TRINITY_DN15900_c0_g1_i1:26-1336(-)